MRTILTEYQREELHRIGTVVSKLNMERWRNGGYGVGTGSCTPGVQRQPTVGDVCKRVDELGDVKSDGIVLLAETTIRRSASTFYHVRSPSRGGTTGSVLT